MLSYVTESESSECAVSAETFKCDAVILSLDEGCLSAFVADEKERQTGWVKSCLPFFIDTWKQPYHYRVYITRGCFNLNTLFYRVLEKKAGFQEVCKTFLTQSALLTYADELIYNYNANRFFSQILITDELVIYGRQISAYLQQLEDAVLQAGDSFKRNRDEWVVRDDLERKIQIRSCAQGEIPVLGKNLRSRMDSSAMRLALAEQRAYAQEVSNLISTSDEVENTSYAPFFRLRRKEYIALSKSLEKRGWHKSKWIYHHLKAEVWQKSSFDETKNVRLLWTFRVHFDHNPHDISGENANSVRIIPLAFFDALSYSEIAFVCEKIAVFMEKCEVNPSQKFRHLVDLLRNPSSVLRHVQLQFLSFLLSVISFFEETHRIGIKSENFNQNNDLDKIAQNFGLMQDVYGALCDFCAEENDTWREDLKNILIPFLGQNLQPFSSMQCSSQPIANPDYYLRRAEEISYQPEMRDTVRLSQMQREGSLYSSQVKSDIFLSMEEFFDAFRRSEEELCTLEGCVGAVLMLMDQGVLSMVTRHSQEHICVQLRSGEQSMFMKARRLYRFVPALIEIESRSRRRGYNPVRQITRFGQFLDRMEPGQNLEEQFRDMADDLAKCGERFEDWDIDLLYDLDVPRLKEGVRVTPEWYPGKWESEVTKITGKQKYLRYEKKKQDYYVDLALEFPLM